MVLKVSQVNEYVNTKATIGFLIQHLFIIVRNTATNYTYHNTHTPIHDTHTHARTNAPIHDTHTQRTHIRTRKQTTHAQQLTCHTTTTPPKPNQQTPLGIPCIRKTVLVVIYQHYRNYILRTQMTK